VGLVHALALGLGGSAGVPFGIAAALAMPPTIRALAVNRPDGLGAFARALAGDDEPQEDARDAADVVMELSPPERAAAAEAAADAVQTLARSLGLPAKLREVGVFEQDLDAVAEWATTAELAGIRRPPRTDREQAVAILREAW
jgi:alcohol dehydrogenase class IV